MDHKVFQYSKIFLKCIPLSPSSLSLPEWRGTSSFGWIIRLIFYSDFSDSSHTQFQFNFTFLTEIKLYESLILIACFKLFNGSPIPKWQYSNMQEDSPWPSPCLYYPPYLLLLNGYPSFTELLLNLQTPQHWYIPPCTLHPLSAWNSLSPVSCVISPQTSRPNTSLSWSIDPLLKSSGAVEHILCSLPSDSTYQLFLICPHYTLRVPIRLELYFLHLFKAQSKVWIQESLFDF